MCLAIMRHFWYACTANANNDMTFVRSLISQQSPFQMLFYCVQIQQKEGNDKVTWQQEHSDPSIYRPSSLIRHDIRPCRGHGQRKPGWPFKVTEALGGRSNLRCFSCCDRCSRSVLRAWRRYFYTHTHTYRNREENSTGAQKARAEGFCSTLSQFLAMGRPWKSDTSQSCLGDWRPEWSIWGSHVANNAYLKQRD